jgi:hypothetical protein
MANIKIADRTRSLGNPNLRVYNRDTTGGFDPAIRQATRGLNAAANVVGSIQETHRIADRQAREHGIANALRAKKAQWAQMKGSDAAAISQEIGPFFDEFIEGQLEGIPLDSTRTEIRDTLLRSKAQVADWATNHVIQETENAVKSADEMTYQSMQEDVSLVPVGDVDELIRIGEEALAKHAELHNNSEFVEVLREKYFDENVQTAYKQWFSEAPASAARSWRENRGELKGLMSTKAYTAVSEMYKVENAQAQYNIALSNALRIGKGNPLAASETVLTPEFREKYDIKASQAMQISQGLRSMHASNVAEQERQRRQMDRDAMEQLIGILHPTEGETDVRGAQMAAFELRRQGKMTSEQYQSFVDGINNADWQVDYGRVNNLRADILSGEKDALDVMNEASMGGLGTAVGSLISLAQTVDKQKQTEGKTVNYYNTVSSDFSRYLSSFSGSKLANAPETTLSEFMDAVQSRATELKGSTATGYDKEFFLAAQELKRNLNKPEFRPPDGIVDYMKETEKLYNAVVKEYNKKGKKEFQPQPGEFGMFIDRIVREVSAEMGRPVQKEDSEILQRAREYLAQGYEKNGVFKEGPPPWTVFGEEEGARFKFTPDTGSDRQAQIDKYREDPTLAPGETAEDKAKYIAGMLGVPTKGKDFDETVADIAAAMEAK